MDPAITVLFVDDEPAMLRVLLRALHGSAFDVVAVESAEEALRLMHYRAVDVLVSDLDMPGMTGLELVKIVRREFPSTLRMLLTGAGTMDRALEAINEGEVHRFLTKPFDAEQFRATMKSLGDRVEKLRRSGDLDARKARREELYGWIEEAFPGTMAVVRNELGEVVIDPPLEELRLLDEAPRSGG